MKTNGVSNFLASILAIALLAACGGSSSGGGAPPPTAAPVAALNCGGGNGGGGFTDAGPGLQAAAVALTGDQETPAVCTGARGSGLILVNVATGDISGGVTVEDITSTVAHIHEGAAGVAGPPVVPLEQDPGDANL